MFNLFRYMLSTTDDKQLVDEIKNGAYLVDVRSKSEYATGTVKGAVNIPLNEVADSLDAFKGKKSIVLFCQSGNRSGQAKNILEKNGFQNVLNGGGWRSLNSLVKGVE